MKILVLVTTAETAHACLDAAVTASAALPGVTIEALHTIVDPERIVTSTEEIQLQRLREHDEGTAAQKAEAARSAFLSWNLTADDKTPVVWWKTQVADEARSVREEAEDVALIVLPQGHDLDTADAFHAALFDARKPLLVVPGDWRAGQQSGFAHVAIGVANDSAERAALAAAQPWLHAAARVTAIRIGEALPEETAGAALGQDVEADWLVVPRRSGIDLGAQIALEAETVGADLLVAGAYRHGPLIEWLMGGTTRHLLAATTLPLLLAH
ncbi:MAG: universal stress protein [Sphingomonas bacterium]